MNNVRQPSRNFRTMKTILLSTFIACVSVSAFAQDAQQRTDSTSQTPYENKVNVQFQKSDMVPISVEDVPKGLRKILKNAQYRGWEQGTILRSSDGKIYQVQIHNAQNSVYRFDAQGNAIKE
jgi:hypothetical protein